MQKKYKCKSREEQSQIFKIIEVLGLPIHDTEKKVSGYYFDKYPVIGWSTANFLCYTFSVEEDLVSKSEFIKLLVDFQYSKPIQLTKDYTASISDTCIKVGCQLVTWDKYEELIQKVNEFKERKAT